MNEYTDWPAILDVLKHYGADIRIVRNGWCPIRCPFHADSNASASFNVEANVFTCFTCCLTKTALGLVADREGMSISEARRFAEGIFDGGGERLREPDRRVRALFGAAGNPAERGDGFQAGGRHRTLFD